MKSLRVTLKLTLYDADPESMEVLKQGFSNSNLLKDIQFGTIGQEDQDSLGLLACGYLDVPDTKAKNPWSLFQKIGDSYVQSEFLPTTAAPAPELEMKFDEFNKRYFANKLIRPAIFYAKNCPSSPEYGGMYYGDKIVVRDSFKNPDYTDGSMSQDVVLLHEMVHLLHQGHGKAFTDEMKRLKAEGAPAPERDTKTEIDYMVALVKNHRRIGIMLPVMTPAELRIRSTRWEAEGSAFRLTTPTPEEIDVDYLERHEDGVYQSLISCLDDAPRYFLPLLRLADECFLTAVAQEYPHLALQCEQERAKRRKQYLEHHSCDFEAMKKEYLVGL